MGPRDRSSEFLNETYAYPTAQWEKLRSAATRLLQRTARQQQTITYSGFCAELSPVLQIEPHGAPLAGLLGQINVLEHQRGRPLLSALVVHKTGDLFPGVGFWNLAEEWLDIDTGGTPDARTAFWAKEMRCCQDYWARHF